MKRILVVGISACLLAWATTSAAYEPGTHDRLTEDAVKNSIINPNSIIDNPGDIPLFDDWGLDITQVYDDDQGGLPIDLGLHEDKQLMQPTGDFKTLITTGAEIEDDDAGSRPLCHFYDPIYNRHLHFGPFVASFSAPEWATGELDDTDVDSDGSLPDQAVCEMGGLGNQTQIYSLKKAEDYFYGAFTDLTKADRQKDFGDLFLSIGHVLHLLEDMGQPQHVRNDMHCDSYKCAAVFSYNPSRYEDHVYDMYNEKAGGPPANPYAAVSLPSARNYWSDSNGEGLADYTNRNFFSAGTLSFTSGASTSYPSPQVDRSAPPFFEDVSVLFPNGVPFAISDFCRHRPAGTCTVSFMSTPLEDHVNGSSPTINIFAASKSFFNAELTDEGEHQVYTLNRKTEQEAWNILYPTIVSYGSGLINHFFRGRLDTIQWDENHPGGPGTQSNFLVTNLSDGDLGVNGGPGGDLGIYYDGSDGNRYRANPQPTPVNLGAYCPLVVNGNPNPICSFSKQDQAQVSVPLPLGHEAAKPNEYIFVYKGPISGDSDTHIIAKTFKPLDPEFELLTWNYTSSTGTWDATVRYDTLGHVLLDAVTPHWTGNCSAPSIYTSLTCSLLSDVAFYRHDASGLDREYTARGDWGVHAFETVETVATPPVVNSVIVSDQYDFAKYTRDVGSGGSLLPFPSPNPYRDCFESVDRIAVNRSYVFVAVNRYANSLSETTNQQTSTPCPYDVAQKGASMYIDIFDHTGAFQSMAELADEFYGDPQVPGSQSSGIRSLAASNQGLCLVGLKTATTTGFVELRAVTGSGPATVIGPAQPLYHADNSPVTNAVGCAATSDRYYVIEANPDETLGAANGGIAVLDSYDLNGNPKGSAVLQQILDDSVKIDSRIRPFKIAASSNMIYVMTWQAPNLPTRVYRYERTVDSNDMDTFTLAPVPAPSTRNPSPLPNPFIATGTQKSGSQAIAVDIYQALSLAGPQ